MVPVGWMEAWDAFADFVVGMEKEPVWGETLGGEAITSCPGWSHHGS